MERNKLLSKHPGLEGFLEHIKKTNELYDLNNPPCTKWGPWSFGNNNWWKKLKARIIHQVYCRNYPNHRAGYSV